MLDVSLLVGITCAEVEAMPVGSTRDADIIVRNESGLEDFVLPVGVACPVGEIIFRIAFISQLFVIQQFEAIGIYHCNLVGDSFEAERTVDVYPCLSFFRFLGGDDDYTIGTTHTEDGK